MLKARDIMTTKIISIKQDETLFDAAKKLFDNNISGAPVVDEENKLIGVITEKDMLNFVFNGNTKNTKVSEIMSKNVISFTPSTDVDKIALVMFERGVKRVIIVDHNNKVVGVVSRHDVIGIILLGQENVNK